MRLAVFLLCFSTSIAWGDFPKLFNTEPDVDQPAMTPEEAVRSIKLPAGFRATVFAAEPDVQNPIAMAWDGKGRLWVAENYTYAERGQRFQLDLRDRVVIFDNTDGDRFKTRTVFTNQVQMLTGIEVGHEGVWLMCPPKLIFIPDRDHDDVPDHDGEVVLDGFTVAQQNYHNFANGLRFGPDGWLYGRCGGSCPGRIGTPGTPDDHRLAMEGGMWRYHPRTKAVEVLTTGTTNPWGHDWNGVGELFFVNTVNGHLWHMIPGAHFTRPFTLDPNRRTYELIDFHADHWHFDTGQSWTKSRDGAANSYGGGHAHSGTMIYQGLNWPKEYRGNLFTLNLHGRRANREILHRHGAGYQARHWDDMFVVGDPWFRGMELSAGPDGSVFVFDWSDAGECHEHTGVHRTSGRIYKIQYKQDVKRVNFDMSNDISMHRPGKLAETHDHNELVDGIDQWHVRQARLELARRANRGDDLAVDITKLKTIFDASSSSRDLVQSMLSLHVSRSVDRDWLTSQLQHRDEHVRAWAIRLLTESWQLDDTLGPVPQSNGRQESTNNEASSLLPVLRTMANEDSSSLVRLTLASTLQRLPVEFRVSLAEALVRHAQDADDHNLPLMIWYGLIPVAESNANGLVQVAKSCRIPKTLQLISRCVAEEIERQPGAIDELILYASGRELEYKTTVLVGISQGLKGWQKAPRPESWARISANPDRSIVAMVNDLSVVFGDGRALQDLHDIVTGKQEADPKTRTAALETLIRSNPPDLRSICETLLRDQKLNVLAARGLSRFDDPAIGKLLVERYRNFRGPYRPQIVSILSSRVSFAGQLLNGIQQGKIPREDLSAYQVRQIHSLGHSELSEKVAAVWGDLRESSGEKKKAIENWKKRLTPQNLANADKSLGRALFKKNCQNCHRLYGEGKSIGPDLTGANRDNLDYLLSNVIDPSAVVDKDFRMSIVLLDDDRTINGLITAESDRTLDIQTATELLTIDKQTVQARRMTDKSPMPDGLLDTLSPDQIRNLISYLQHPSQVPLP